MACCGQLRSAFRLESAGTPTVPTSPSRTPPSPNPNAPPPSTHRPVLNAGPTTPGVILHYTQETPVLVRGPVSGREYRFSRSDPNHAVDARDADTLIRTGLFMPTRAR